MHRFHACITDTGDDTVLLDEEDSRHALTVLRLKPADRVAIIQNGVLWDSEIVSVIEKNVRVRKIHPLPSTEPLLHVTLFQGLPKSDKMDWIVQKATEIGVSDIVPVEMIRSVSKLKNPENHSKLDRWQRIVREASKQSGRCIIPKIHSPVSFRDLLGSLPLPDVCIVPWEEAASFGPLAFHESHPSLTDIGILIGPEGGISPEEMELLESSGFIPVTLGRRILRTETAGLVAVSALLCLYGEMERK